MRDDTFLIFAMDPTILDSADDTEWARAEIRRVVDVRTVVIAGDEAPDEIAQMLTLRSAARWRLDGGIDYRFTRGEWWEEARWHDRSIPKRGRGHAEEWRALREERDAAIAAHYQHYVNIRGLYLCRDHAGSHAICHTPFAARFAHLPSASVMMVVWGRTPSNGPTG